MDDKTYQCDKCPLSFKSTQHSDKHKLVHNLQRQYVCPLCMSAFGNAEGLEGHMKNHKEFNQDEEEEEEASNPSGSGLNGDEIPITSQNSFADELGSCDFFGNMIVMFSILE